VEKQKTMKKRDKKVNAYQIALVFKRGVYQRIQKQNHWLWNETFCIMMQNRFIHCATELNILLKDEQLAVHCAAVK
jgi:hypothetical protein